MIRARIWFRCAVVHDPVSPIIVKPAVIGWQAKFRNIDLTIERKFKGDELLKRMKGWFTVNPHEVIDEINKIAKLKIIDDKELVVEFENKEDFDILQKSLKEKFGDQIDIELIEKEKYW